MIIGRVIVFNTGLIIMFNKPSSTPAIRYSFVLPLTTNPGTNILATYNATELPNILIIKPIIRTNNIVTPRDKKLNIDF